MKHLSPLRGWFTALLVFIFGSLLHAQTAWNFAAPTSATGGALADNGKGMCTDAAGNVYIAGVFSGTDDFDLGGGSNTFTSAGNDGFLACYNKNGGFLWKVIVSGTGSDFNTYLTGVATNGTYVWFAGSVNMPGAPSIMSSTNTVTITSGTGLPASTDAFVAKVACSNGAIQWATTFGGSTNNDAATGLTIDPNGSCYTVGVYGGGYTLGSVTAPAPNGSSDLYVAKISAGGVLRRFASGGSSGGDMQFNGGGICYAPGASPNIVAVGSAPLGGGVASYAPFNNIPLAGSNDGVLLELDTVLNFTNAIVMGTANNEELEGACYDPFSGQVYVSGFFNAGTITVPGAGTLTSTTGEDMFIGSYSVSGNVFNWAKSASGANNERAYAIAADGQGGIIIAGESSSPTCVFSGSVNASGGGGVNDIVVARYSTSGTAIWALAASSPGGDDAKAVACYVQPSPYVQSVFVTGNFQNGATFGALTPLAATGGNDFFLARINDAALPLTATQSQVNLTCNGVCNGSATVVASGGTAPYTYSWSPAGGSGATASLLCATNYTVTITDAALTSITKTFSITQPSAITSSTVSQTNVACFGGSNGAATITASGGTGSLTYNWTPGNPTGDGTVSVSGLNAAQTWTCTITDGNSCVRTQTVNITAPSALVVTPASQINVSCSGGSNGTASINTPTGGAGGYTYNWTPGNPSGDGTTSVTGLFVTTWTCTVTDANLCVNTATFNITGPSAIVVTPVSQTNISCNGGSNGTASVSASGGTGSLTYNWTPGNPSGDGTNSVTGLAVGTWTCTVTDANLCVNTATFNITAPSAIVVTPVSQTNISCNGGSNGTASVSASGGTGSLTYNWTPGNPSGDGTNSVTGLTLGTWTCTVTDASLCVNTATFNITAPSAIVVTPVSQTNISCNGGSNGTASVSASGGTGSLTYNWTPGNPSGDGTNSVTGLTLGTWTCTVTDANLCVNTATFNITAPSAIVVTPVSQTNISCNGGSNGTASVSASGGTGSLTYNWTPGNPSGDGTNSVTGLTVGTWTCTVTDANLCVNTATFNITAPSAIVVTPVSQTNISCNGGSNGTASVSASGGTGSLTYNWTPGNPSGDGTNSVTGLTLGTWTCTVTDANLCVNTATFNITAPSAIVVTPVSQTNISCNGGSNGTASVSASGGTGSLTYNWTPGNPSGDGTNSVTGLTLGTWTCTVTDANLCVNTATFNITAPSAIVVTPVSQTNISCNGGSNGAASVSASGGTGSLTYNWTPGNPSGDGTNSVTGLTASTWTCTVTDANLCVNTATFNITAPSAIVVTPVSQTNISCNGGSNGTASVSASGGTGSLTYNWTPGNPSGDGTNSVTGLSVGTWTCTVTDANLCVNTATFNITAPSAIVVTPASQTNISCNGGSDGAASINTPTGGAGGYTYNWTPGNPTGDGTVSITGLTSGTWTCTVTDANSCVNTATFNITAPSAVVVTPVSQTNISCSGGSNGAASVSASGGTGSLTYNWTPGNPTGDGTNSVSGLTSGTWTCTVTDANSCVNTATFNITQPSAITASASSTPESCAGNDGTAAVTASGGTGSLTYSWAPSGGTAATATGLASGNYTCTITDANSCIATRTVAVAGSSAPSASISSHTDATCSISCDGAATVLASGGAGGYTYSWSPSGGSAATATGLCDGPYTVTVTDASSCQATATVLITAPLPVGVTVATLSNVTCNGANDGAASVSVSGGTPSYSYNWTPGNPTGDGTASVSGLAPGTYTCTVTDGNLCIGSRTLSITQPSALVVSSQSQTNVACNGNNTGAASVSVSGGAGGNTLNWTPGNPTGDGSASVTNLTAGTWTCSVTDANGCNSTQTFSLTEPTAISVSSTTTPETCSGNDGTASVSPSGGTPGYTYSWAPSGGTANTATGLASGNYTCTITDANSCIATQTVNVGGSGAGPSVSMASSTNVSCFGGSNGAATVNVSGGATPYSFAWTPTGGTAATASGLTSATYTCTVTDNNGCVGTETVMITEPPVLSVSITPVSAICDGQSTNLVTSTNGGTLSYTYNWMPGSATSVNLNVSPSTTTAYTVTVTDANGCTDSDITTVAVNPLPALTITATPSNSIVCTGNQATLTATGAQGYSWTGGITNGVAFIPPSTTTYTVTGTSAAGCTSTAQATLTVQSCANQTQLNATWCGATNCTNNDLIVANTVSSATNYEFWFQNTSLGYSQTRQKGNGIASISLSWIAGLQYGVTYQVRVRAFVGGVWQAYGPTCTLTMAPAVPLPQLTNCAATNLTLASTIGVTTVAGAQDYEWEITNSTQPYTLVIQRGSPTTTFGLSSFAGLQYGRTYNVRIRAKVGGVWGQYGPTCTFSMQASPPPTQLTTLCGATGVNSASTLAWTAVGGATNYRVNITNSALGYNQTRTKGNSGTTMSVSLFNGLIINNTYTVTISSYIGGAWGAYGPVCTITMGGSVRITAEREEDNADFNFGISMYPNPVGDGINPTISITGADQQEAIVTIVDLAGRTVAVYKLFVDGDEYSTELTEFPDLVAGMYIMQVQVGDKVQSQKFIAE